MPFTPYHFGPSAFIGLVLRKWIDVPVFILANVIVDIEVLVVMIFGLGAPHHRCSHTLLVGAAVGLLWGIAAYPLRRLFKVVMRTLCISYEPNFLKMVFSGILGVWLHVLIDGAYHPDVQVFWPNETKSLWITVVSRISREQIKTICIAFLIAAVVPYAIAVVSYMKGRRREAEPW
ncbi:MAG: metal-dependent hydrolase [Planctomycetota bacterium]